jgi:hypothetical protein
MKPVEELVAKLRMGKVIREEKVIEESTRRTPSLPVISALTMRQWQEERKTPTLRLRQRKCP